MKNYLKQFAEWVTDSKIDPVTFGTWVSILLTIVTIGLSFIIIDSIVNPILHRQIILALTDKIPDEDILSLHNLLSHTITTVHIISAIAGMLVAYVLLSKIVFRPIRETISAQHRFIADASHELRTPLSVMKAEIEATLLAKTAVSQSEMIGTMKSNLEEVDRMASIIKNLIILTDIRAKTPEMVFSKVDLKQVIANVAERLKSNAAKKDITINSDRAQSVSVWANQTAMEEMLRNVMTNAINYTPHGGMISVYSQIKNKDDAEIYVQDTGIGIPKKDLPHIFNPFFRADNAPAKTDGQRRGVSGLGLAIVRDIIKKHKGNIDISSKIGGGTTVRIRLHINPPVTV